MDQAVTRTRPDQSVIAAFLSSFIIVLGILLIASPYIFQYTVWTSARINDDLFGPIIIGMAITRLALWSPQYRWLSLGNVIFGLWVAVSPFVLGYYHSLGALLVNVIIGLLAALFSASGLMVRRR